MTRDIDARTDRYVEDFCDLDPLTATYAGIAGHDHELPDLSPDGFAAREELNRTALADVVGLDAADDLEETAKAAFLERTGLAVEAAEAGIARSQFSVIESGVHELREAFDLMPTETEDDWSNIRARLAGLPKAVADYRTTLTEEAAAGHVAAARQYAEVAGQIRNWTGQEGSGGDFFASMISDGPGTMKSDLEKAATNATEAYAEFGRFLDTEMVSKGRSTEPVGREHYALASREFLGAKIDLEETYAWGWDELKRLEDDMLDTGRRILPSATSIQEVVDHLDADPSTKIGKDDLRGWMQKLADRVIRELGGSHFDIPEPIRRIECMIAPTNDGGIYYTGPSEDFSRPGRMWWSVPDSVTEFSPWRETTTVFHEGVPGHHLQVAQTVYRSDLLNRWQRLLCWVSGHGEGWALYAERLMDDLGYLDDPADRLGMLDAQSLRAARVIIDIGMHLELEIPRDNPFGFHPGEPWTPELGRTFMGEHCRMDPAFIDFEVKRYLGWPGQAPSYKVGERIWLEARDAARVRAGDAWDIKDFHRRALDLGSIGLDPLREALARL